MGKMKQRQAGILMHISSLPGEYSIGSFGEVARLFVDKIAEAGFSLWQVLPLSMADDCNSPYKSMASFGANPMLIDLPTLYEESLITAEELASAVQTSEYAVEYDRLIEERLSLLRLASTRVLDRTEIAEYVDSRQDLSRVACFMALKSANGGAPWQTWQNFECDIDELFFWQFVQFKFYTQWYALKSYANSRGISIIGDLPIYVAEDSADVWAEPMQFLLDEKGYPTEVAGVPPYYFAKDGQLWGNPLYNWKKMRDDGFAWWANRLRHAFTMYDGVRIDHFRALEAYWSVPAGAVSAKEGRWVKGPGRALVSLINEIADGRLVIAEDLGDITDSVRALLKYSKMPGMRVLQFGFLSDDDSLHLPHNIPENSIAYTGTHDNNTILGYTWELDDGGRVRFFDYIGADHSRWESAPDAAIRSLYQSAARAVIIPIQDIYGYGADTRMDTPGVAKGNWGFRLTRDALEKFPVEKYKYLHNLYKR